MLSIYKSFRLRGFAYARRNTFVPPAERIVHNGKNAQGEPQASVHQQFVTAGETRGDQVSILKGLQAGDVVVTAGQLKLHNDALVQIDNSVKLTNDAAPVPQDH